MYFPHLSSRVLIGICLLGALVSFVSGGILYARFQGNMRTLSERLNTLGPLKVHAIADGDTLSVLPRFGKPRTVRLLGINTPEIAHPGLRIKEECHGQEARDFVRKIAQGRYATLEYDSAKGMFEDKGRLLAYVFIYESYLGAVFGFGSIDLNKHLLEVGLAEEWLYKGSYRRADEFLAAETAAREAGIGAWASCPDFKRHPRSKR